MAIKLWIDDVRPAPRGYYWCRSVNDAKQVIQLCDAILMKMCDGEFEIEVLDIDHDAGEYVGKGGDYIKLLDWLEETRRDYPIHIHSMNPVGIENMRAIIKRNRWEEV